MGISTMTQPEVVSLTPSKQFTGWSYTIKSKYLLKLQTTIQLHMSVFGIYLIDFRFTYLLKATPMANNLLLKAVYKRIS